ncbi:succinylglutamate desuccinylase/aspartoacylase family protein [Paraburkholderia sp. MM5477-R1]|uniref:succinylglutamate desuccinylase/aspartoacylase family protein n=1 Tax=Paraburkholderia sp. MM5477-R1 TaxID=2991062 RepID=UPI003D2423E1
MTKEIQRINIDAGFPGTRRQITVHRYGTRGARPKIYIQAGLHAEEIPGMLTIAHLARRLDDADSRGEILGEVVLVPFVNPIGAATWINGVLVGRNDLGGEGNFNRHWPSVGKSVAAKARHRLGDDEAENLQLLRRILERHADDLPDESEVQKIKKTAFQLAFDADVVIDVHCDRDAIIHAYTYKSTWPHVADLCAQTACEAVFLEDGLENAGTSTDLFTGTWEIVRKELRHLFPIPIGCHSVTLELRGQADVCDEFASADADALLKFLQRREVVAGDPGPLPEPLCKPTSLDATDLLTAPGGGIVTYKVPLGARVSRGEVIAEIVDPSADDPLGSAIAVRTRTDGIVATRTLIRFVPRGEVIGKVVGAVRLRSGPLLER